MDPLSLSLGDSCAFRSHARGWVRAEITGLEGERARLFMVDHGDQCSAPRRLLKPLTSRFSETPSFYLMFHESHAPESEERSAVSGTDGAKKVIERLAFSSDRITVEVSPNRIHLIRY